MRRLLLYFLAVGTVTFWGASFPLTKAALAYLGPTSIAFLRWAISAVLLVSWLAWQRRLPQASQLMRESGRTASWVALLGITFFYFFENLALRYTTATNAGVLSNLVSVFIVLLGAVVLRERLSGIEWAALAAAFAGAVLVSQGAGHLAFAGPGLFGDALMVVAGLLGAAYSVGGKGLVSRYRPDVVTTVVAVLGALFLLPLALWEGLTLILPWQAWGALLLLGIGAGALANLWWLELLSKMAASRAAPVLFLVPVVSTLLSIVMLHEPLTPLIVVGGLLVLAGVAVTQWGRNGERRAAGDAQRAISNP